MLKITKKANIKPVQTNEHVIQEKDVEENVRKIINSGKKNVLSSIVQLYIGCPSINASILAEIFRIGTSQLTQHNYMQTLSLLLDVYKLPHDEKEFRYYLKNKHKIDPVLFLLVLLQRKDQSITLKLASSIIDSYTFNLMLNGQQVITIWKKHLKQTIQQVQSIQQIQSILKKEEGDKAKNEGKRKEEVVSGFRRITIPL